VKKLKKPIVRVKNKTFSIVFLASCLAGGYFAHKFFEFNPVIARALLGVATLFLVWVEFLSSWKSIDEPSEIHLEIPKDLRYFVYGFIVSAISIWACIQVLQLISYYNRS
jgi:hypothetical protein